MRLLLILSLALLLGGCSKDAWQSLSKSIAAARKGDNNACYIKKYLIGWGKEHKESDSGFATSYSIITDQGTLYVDDGAVYQEIMQGQGKEISIIMSAAPGGWVVDLPGDSDRKRIRTNFMCHQGYANP